jgi:hypothetical protein
MLEKNKEGKSGDESPHSRTDHSGIIGADFTTAA